MKKSKTFLYMLLNKYERIHSDKMSYYGNHVGFTKEEEGFMLAELNLLYSIKEDLQQLVDIVNE